MKIIIAEKNAAKLNDMKIGLSNYVNIEFHNGDIFDTKADAMVSPANSYGYMDGGLDLAMAKRWPGIEDKVKARIKKEPFGELLVGKAFSIHIDNNDKWNMLIVAPTMRIPMLIHPINAYLSTRAAIDVAVKENYKSIVMSGMGTGTGGIDPEEAGWAMYKGIKHALMLDYKPKLSPNWKGTAAEHLRIGYPDAEY